MRIKSDRFDSKTEDMRDLIDGDYSFPKDIPVDLYGKRVFPSKSNPSNLDDAQQDIREFYDMEGDAGLKPE